MCRLHPLNTKPQLASAVSGSRSAHLDFGSQVNEHCEDGGSLTAAVALHVGMSEQLRTGYVERHGCKTVTAVSLGHVFAAKAAYDVD